MAHSSVLLALLSECHFSSSALTVTIHLFWCFLTRIGSPCGIRTMNRTKPKCSESASCGLICFYVTTLKIFRSSNVFDQTLGCITLSWTLGLFLAKSLSFKKFLTGITVSFGTYILQSDSCVGGGTVFTQQNVLQVLDKYGC